MSTTKLPSSAEISAEIDPADASLFLYGLGQGSRVTGRIAKLADVERTVDVALRALYPGGPPEANSASGPINA
ncbi:hypothetical protein [Bradyrhizobium sp. 1]|uniref:hypothetical protein n=1 Tax=Bradyrhizobium sp. 1 TaxID=241591 RepID=UPI001FF7FB47|nr:hypothetical protein [Bradyrhizobium sp. 1]MCK1393918.1 hypothetical protein [Bradyrhizobium sp. 1]